MVHLYTVPGIAVTLAQVECTSTLDTVNAVGTRIDQWRGFGLWKDGFGEAITRHSQFAVNPCMCYTYTWYTLFTLFMTISAQDSLVPGMARLEHLQMVGALELLTQQHY